MAIARGRLIVFEGLDRTGKTTQSTKLVQYLRDTCGQKVEHLRFPDRSTLIGKTISNYLTGGNGNKSTKDEAEEKKKKKKSNDDDAENEGGEEEGRDQDPDPRAIHLLFTANRWESASKLETLLSTGTTVILDRYYYSGCVYSAAKQIPGMDLAWCRLSEVGLPRPDLCVFLDLEPEVAERRAGFGGERYENAEMQKRVRELYKLMRGYGDEGEDMVVVDAGRSVEVVAEEVRLVVEGMEERFKREPWPLRRVRPW